jgi:long-chain acyl-CoA synthetase
MPDPAAVDRPWLSSYPPGVPATYAWPEVTLPRLLDDAARDFPDLEAVLAGGGAWTWDEVRSLASAVAGGLQARGVGPGDRVGLALPNGPAAVAVAFGTWRAGAVLVLLDPELPRPVRDAVLDGTRPRLTVAAHADWPEAAGTVVVTTAGDWRPAPGRLARMWSRLRTRRSRPPSDAGAEAPALAWDDLVADPAGDTPRWPTVPVDAPAVLAPTGGTTGHRRIVTLTHRNLVANAFQARLWVPDVQAGRERVLAATPFTHPFGLTVGLLAGTLSAATLVVPDERDGTALAASLADHEPTLFPAVPALLEDLVAAADEGSVDLSSLRVCLVGGAPLGPELAARYRAMSGQGRLREGYGVSEASPLTHANPVYGRAHHGRGGLPVTGTVSVVVDPDDPTRVLPTGRVGLLAVAGPQVMAGYWDDPEATAAVLRDGWLLTGDLAVTDASGHVEIVDRVVDVVVTSAGAVFPGDVEQVLLDHPAVTGARARAHPTLEGTDEVVADVVLDPATADLEETAEALAAHCAAHLPPHAVPARIDVVDAPAEGDDPTVIRHRDGARVARVDQEVAG